MVAISLPVGKSGSDQPRPQAYTRLTSDSGKLGAKHDMRPGRIFPLSSTGDVPFDFSPRTTWNEAGILSCLLACSRLSHSGDGTKMRKGRRK